MFKLVVLHDIIFIYLCMFFSCDFKIFHVGKFNFPVTVLCIVGVSFQVFICPWSTCIHVFLILEVKVTVFAGAFICKL